MTGKRKRTSKATSKPAATVYETMGGEKAVAAAVEGMYFRMMGDVVLRPFFEGVDVEAVKKTQVAFFSQLLGGPQRYKGPGMRELHARMKIEQRHFDRVVQHLVASLKSLAVETSVIDRVVAAVAPLADEIVNTATAEDSLAADNLEALVFQQMVDHSPVNIMRADKDFVIRYVNEASRRTLSKMEHLLPCKVSEIVGQSVDIFHKNPSHQRRLLSDPKHLPHQANIQLGPETLSLLVSPIFDAQQRYMGAMVTWEVVTEKLRLEALNQDYAGQIAAISHGQPVCEYKMDGTVVSTNEKFRQLFGYSEEEMVGRPASMFSDEATQRTAQYQAAYKQLWERVNRGETCTGVGRRATKQGKEIWIYYAYNPIPGKDGKPYRVVNHLRDVTEETLQNADYAGQIAAISQAQPVSEYAMDGTVISANENFEKLLGYSKEELMGKSASLFVDEATRQTAEYQVEFREMWEKLKRGESCSGTGKRITKLGKEIWIYYSYNPIAGKDGKVYKVVNYFRDVTEERLQNANYEGQIAAISKSQAVIEFKMDGTIVAANDNFLRTMGYTLDEIKGKHHSLFVEETYRHSPEYREFWAKLNRGEYVADEFKRVGKGGKQVWLQASYNPILDLNGKPFKVVKYATDLTEAKTALNAMMTDVDMLSKAAVAGKLSTRADVSKHGREYQGIVQGVNETLDSVVGPVHAVGKVLHEIAEGNLRVQLEGEYAGDFKDLADSVNMLRAKVNSALHKIEENTSGLVLASENLTTVSQQMSANAEETAAQANTVAQATHHVSTNLNSVATGAEEMSATVHSIAGNATEAAKIAGEAVQTARSANATVQKLGESSAEIGQVIKVITSIAQQTNLLALNATIEAARAGEAGKGFAVVASEVKELAKQTAKATEDISQKITAIQEDTKRAVESIGSITGIIGKINDISGTIATAVEEQSATTNEMSRNVSEAAKGSGDISQNIQGVAEAAESTTRGAQDAQKAAVALSEMSTQLKHQVGQFKLAEIDEARAKAHGATA